MPLPSLISAAIQFGPPPEPDLAWPAGSQPPSASQLTLLCVDGLRERHLSQLLAALPSLTALEWNPIIDPAAADEDNTPRAAAVDLELVLAALARSRNTLGHLALNTRYAAPSTRGRSAVPSAGGHGRAGGLPPMPIVVFLTGVEFPPPAGQPTMARCLLRSLEDLMLTTEVGRALHEVALWLGEARSRAPRLQLLRFTLQEYFGKVRAEIQDARDEVEERAEEVGAETEYFFNV
ncbi:hypothetical protein C8A05DRAFT_36013 [Staphylotrichum tortipilum]|uniref:Uncharacterized protein n=1 Tax=Staphylotrichum tortipilum TaxID=2831512 RepID=A0AAN6RR46_9PEZI|nr:hypothetical protein C8A05DRAFT_36013 [Staphylotrichum longicolle]